MKISKLFTWLLFPFSLAVNATTTSSDNCPNLNSISRINQNHYVAGDWDGIIQGANPNGEIKNFKEVVYSAENQTNPFVSGKLLHCTYDLNNQKKLDMRLPTGRNRATITNSSNWNNLEFFGRSSPQYLCEESLERCQFKLK